MHTMARRYGYLAAFTLIPLFLIGCGMGGSGGSGLGLMPPIHTKPPQVGVSYTPAQIRHAYGIDQLSTTGAGQTIAIVDAFGSPTIQQDLNTFSARFGLPPATLNVITPQAMPAQPDSGWALETSLDVEWAHAIAPDARLLLVLSPTTSLPDLLNAVDYAAQHAAQVSMSWGTTEFATETSLDMHFNLPGVTFFASAGDTGPGVCWPAVSPFVVGVGGTTLKLTAANTRNTETAWSGSGGGQSLYEPEPSFQQAWQTTGFRQVPDVSYNADPNTGYLVYDSTPLNGQSGWTTVGGTSAGTSQWAALYALANAGRAAPLTGDEPLYTLGSPTTYLNNFFDITTGSNSKFSAQTGYDLITGIGVPRANVLLTKLAAL